MWSPASGAPLASLLCHRGAVNDVAMGRQGRYLATAGADGVVKVWDVRTFRCLATRTADDAVHTLDVSDQGLLALGVGRRVQVWRGWETRGGNGSGSSLTYLRHELHAAPAQYRASSDPFSTRNVSAACVRFRPLEDVLGVGHTDGFSALLVPGAGEANFDAFEANPFETPKQRREREVHALMNKLQPDTIALDPDFVGGVDADPAARQREIRDAQEAANRTRKEEAAARPGKNKARGRNKIRAKLRKKQQNVVDEQGEKLKAALRKDGGKASADARARQEARRAELKAQAPPSVQRFF